MFSQVKFVSPIKSVGFGERDIMASVMSMAAEGKVKYSNLIIGRYIDFYCILFNLGLLFALKRGCCAGKF